MAKNPKNEAAKNPQSSRQPASSGVTQDFNCCPIKVGDKVHLHGEVTALNGDYVNVRLNAPEGETGQEITSVRSCCVCCDDPESAGPADQSKPKGKVG